MSFFKIRDKKTGLFSKGGMNMLDDGSKRHVYHDINHWSKKGKVWNSKQALGGHLAQYVSVPYELDKPIKVKIPEDWEIVEFEMIEKCVVNAREYTIEHSGRIKKRNEKVAILNINEDKGVIIQ